MIGPIAEVQSDDKSIFPLKRTGHFQRRIITSNFCDGYISVTQTSGNHRGCVFDSQSLAKPLPITLSHPDQANRLFVDHILLAVGVHIAQTYGGMRPVSRLVRGVLAPWQERRAKEMIAANLDGVPVKELARECRLSTAHFSRAFRRSVGVAPHNWLIEQRIVLSKKKLRDDRLSIADVAAECGFSDHAHFSRHFARIAGVTPSAWRRALKE